MSLSSPAGITLNTPMTTNDHRDVYFLYANDTLTEIFTFTVHTGVRSCQILAKRVIVPHHRHFLSYVEDEAMFKHRGLRRFKWYRFFIVNHIPLIASLIESAWNVSLYCHVSAVLSCRTLDLYALPGTSRSMLDLNCISVRLCLSMSNISEFVYPRFITF